LSTQSLSGTLVAGTLASGSSTVLTVKFKTNLNSSSATPKIYERTRNQAAKVIINIIYNNGSTDMNVPLTLSIQDCVCCGAYTTSGTWREFMCHNLGADQNLDPFTYVVGNADGSGGTLGWLFQWGRKADGHQLRNSATTTTLATNSANAGSSFIPNLNSDYSWLTTVNMTLWGATKTANDPCPAGYRVPTKIEWQSTFASNSYSQSDPGDATANTWTWTGNGYKVGNGLFLPAAGARNWGTAAVENVGASGSYWSSTPQSSDCAATTSFGSSKVNTYGSMTYHADGESVRCIAEQ